MGKIGHYAKAIVFAKWSVWIKKENFQKHAKNDTRAILGLFFAKSDSKSTYYSKNDKFSKIAKNKSR